MWGLVAAAWAADPAAERIAAADRVLQQVRAGHATGLTSVEVVYTWSVRVRDAELAAGVPTARANHRQRMEALLAATSALVASGAAPGSEADAARYFVLEASLDPAPPPAPAAPAPAGTPAPGGGSAACFGACDKAYEGCTTDAEHLRLGVGTVEPNVACQRTADERCGLGRSQTAVECRDRELRACVAAERAASCARQQTLCTARCR